MRSPLAPLPSRAPFALLVVAALSVVPLAQCNGNSSNDAITTSVSIGPAGGAIASYDYVVELLVPPGALTASVTFTIAPVNAPGTATVLAPAYIIGPATVVFASPAVISFAEGAVEIDPPHDPTDLRVASYAGSAWTPLGGQSVDAIAGTIEAPTLGLAPTPYSVILPPATGDVCVSLSEPRSVCEAPSYPGKCAGYPGAIAEACTVKGTAAAVSCCFPAGEPLCFTQTETDCARPCAQLPGSTAQSCVPDVGPPFGAGLAGGLPQSTCCFAAGAAVCVAPPASGCAAVSGTTAAADGSCCYPVGTLPATLPDGGTALVADAGGGMDAEADSGADDAGTNPD